MRLLALLALLAAGCGPAPIRPDPIPPDASDEASCKAACARMEELKCPGWDGSAGPDEVRGTEDDVPCARACVDVVSAYQGATLHQDCVVRALDCDEVEGCFE